MLLEGVPLSDFGQRQYLAWANSVSRMLQALGLEAPSPKLEKQPAALADHLAGKRLQTAPEMIWPRRKQGEAAD
jgi:hypothetical protein